MDFVERMQGRFQRFDPDTLFKFTALDARVQKHLTKVYATLACAIAVSALGAVAHLAFHIGGFLTFSVAFVALLGLGFTTPSLENLNIRYGMLAAFAFCQGGSIGPLVQHALNVNPGIIVIGLLGTLAVFASFSAAALLSPRRSYLFLGGLLSTAVTSFLFMRLGGWILGASAAVFQIELYLGLMVFALYVVFDTQMVIEHASAGRLDHVKDALDLFVDFFAVFVRVIIILLQNQEKKDKKKRRSE